MQRRGGERCGTAAAAVGQAIAGYLLTTVNQYSQATPALGRRREACLLVSFAIVFVVLGVLPPLVRRLLDGKCLEIKMLRAYIPENRARKKQVKSRKWFRNQAGTATNV